MFSKINLSSKPTFLKEYLYFFLSALRKSNDKRRLKGYHQWLSQEQQIESKGIVSAVLSLRMNICNRYAQTEEEAEEMLNDAFLRIFMKINLYDSTLPFVGWLHTILVRSAINYLKKYQHQPLIDDIEWADHRHISDSENILGLISADELILLVRKLPPSYRAAFNLAAIEGYSHTEIAAMLGVTEGTSRSNLMIARQKLQIMVLQSNKITK